MRRPLIALLTSIPLFLGADWLAFRGSDNRGVAANEQLPTKVVPGDTVAWKVSLPGKAVSGPIVIGDRVVVTAASGPVVQDRLHVICLDAQSGKELWQRNFWATGRPHHHPMSSNAAPTPASD